MRNLNRYLAFILILGASFCVSSVQLSNSSNQATPPMFIGHDQQCPTWFFWNESSHRCQHGPDVPGVFSNQRRNQTSLEWLYSMTYDNKTQSTVVATSPFGDLQPKWHGTVLLPENRSELNDAMCGKSNREGLLCSRCKPSYGPAVFSYKHKCVKCSTSYLGWFLYFCVSLLPTTIFFLIIVFCQVRTTSAPMNFFVYACQIISVSISILPQEIVYHSEHTKLISSFIATLFTSWNLDFFRLIIPPFCVSESLSNLQVLCMDYMIAFYPFLLTVVMYICIQQHARGCRLLVCLWTPFGYCLSPLRRFEQKPSIVPIFASFLLLSSTKILCVSLSLLQVGSFTNLSNVGEVARHNNMLYFDPSLKVFGHSHLPYAIIAALVATTFVIIPGLLLTLYPTRLFQKFLNFCGFSCHAVHAFADAFNGCYKNGTNGTRDYRCFAGFYLFARVFGIVTITFMSTSWLHFPLLKIWSIVSLFIMALASPYKRRLFNTIDSLGLALIAFRFCVVEVLGISNVLSIAFLTLYLAVPIGYKITLTMNCCSCDKLTDLLCQATDASSVLPLIQGEAGDVERSLPERQILYSDGYGILYEENEAAQTADSGNRISRLYNYGSIQ